MALKTYNPTTPGRRGLVLVDRAGLWKGKPEKSLTEGLRNKGGRNNNGRITARRRGGGHKRRYRIIDFKRLKHDVEATVLRLEYDPNRTAFIALIKYAAGELSYILAPQRLREGDTIQFPDGVSVTAEARAEDGSWTLAFAGDEPVEELLARAGAMPLPPYIAQRRAADERDAQDYQTLFADKAGAVAAPTAALHFTPELVERLDAAGIVRETLTLHVGAGTFLPVKADDTAQHKMHAEWGEIPAEAVEVGA